MAKILFVDDHHSAVKGVMEYLGIAGYQTDYASDGVTGFGVLEEIDLVFTDVEMPIMTGHEFARQVKKEYNIPIIGLSSRPPSTGNCPSCKSPYWNIPKKKTKMVSKG